MTAHHWHVLGAGAMGCLFAARLQDSGCDITLVVRDTRPDPVALVLEDGEDAREMKFPTTTAADRAPISHLLVTTKAYDVVDAVSSLAHRLDRDSQVLLLANGLGFASELSGRYPWLAPYCGTTTEGAYRVSSFRIRHAGHGATRIGRSGELSPPDVGLLRSEQLDAIRGTLGASQVQAANQPESHPHCGARLPQRRAAVQARTGAGGGRSVQ